MKHTTRTLLLAALAAMFAGCGQSSTPNVGSASSDPPEVSDTTVGSDAIDTIASPVATVARFYEALRSGEENAIAELLTDKARSETANSGLDIESQGSAQLEYQLGEVDYVDESMDGAHVKSLWIDFAPSGEKVATEVIWVLRKQQEGWRIAGMATQVAEGELPLLFNFEDPEDMLQKKAYVESQHQQAEDAMMQQTARPEAATASESVVR
jgi:hypothetical protein